jgi:transcription elongation factor GreA
MADNVTWLTQEAFDRLTAELEYLSGPGRAEIAKRVQSTREEGDLKENGGYHAAREELAKTDGRILYLEQMLRTAVVGEAPSVDGGVAVGTVVVARILGDEETFLLASREMAVDIELDVYSDDSPLGRAILGLQPGAATSYHTPTGRKVDVEILEVRTYAG